MTLIIHLVICLVVFNSYNILCDGASFEKFLHEKQEYHQEVDRLFYTFYFNNSSGQLSTDVNTNEQHRSQPLPSPDWATHSATYDDVTAEEEEDDDLDASQPTLFEEENYRPRAQADGRSIMIEDLPDENVFSGDSGFFLKAKIGDDVEGYEYSGSGDSRMEETTLVVQETSTSIAVEPDKAVYFQCGAHLKTEITSCIELSLNVRTLLHEMSLHSVAESGYYSVTSNKYFLNLFVTCVSTIIIPPSCPIHVINIVKLVTDGVIGFAHRHNGSDDFYGNVDERHFDCFHTHLQLLRSCLNARLSNVRLESLVRIVIVRAKEVLVQECLDLQEVQQCVVGAMSKCEDLTSVRLVQDMFDATAREFPSCGVNTTRSVNNAALGSPLGIVLTLTLGALVRGFQKQLHN